MASEISSAPEGSALEAWAKAARPHQWAKNFLVLIPLLLSGQFLDPGAGTRTLIAFGLVCACASAVYILNDIADLAHDRAHTTKRLRPFASGRLPVRIGVAVGAAVLVATLAGGFALDLRFGWLLALYVGVTSLYSLHLKRIAVVDVATLAALYGLRLAMGAAAAGVPLSAWLLVFAGAFFLSLGLAKRHVEIREQSQGGVIAGRGYRAGDGPFTLGLGLACAMTALLVMVLFLVFEAFVSDYAHSQFLWTAPALTFLWLGRVWLLAARGELRNRCCETTANATPASLQARTIARQSSAPRAIGFSTRTCLPAAAAATTCARWAAGGEVMMTASTSCLASRCSTLGSSGTP